MGRNILRPYNGARLRRWIKLREGGVEEIVDAGAVLGGDGEDGNADAMENVGVGFLRHGVDFVDGNHKRFAGSTQEAGEFFVEGRKAGLAVHDQHEQRGLLDGYMSLAQDFLRDQGFVIGDDAAGIDNFQRATTPFGFAIDAVACDAGLVGDDGAARAGQTVEERGLAHVGAANDDQRWELVCHKFVGRTNHGAAGVLCNLPM